MSFYIMRQDTSIEGSCSLDGVPNGIVPEAWLQGKPLPDPAPGNKMIFNLSKQSGDYRGHIISSFITLFHDGLKMALDEQGVDKVDYFPVMLGDPKTHEPEAGYWLVNILRVLDCVDMEKSQIKRWGSGLGFHFMSMVIDPTKTGKAKLFRLRDDPTKIIINEELKHYFDQTDMLVGVTLIKTEDYADF